MSTTGQTKSYQTPLQRYKKNLHFIFTPWAFGNKSACLKIRPFVCKYHLRTDINDFRILGIWSYQALSGFFFSCHWKTSSCLDNPKVSATAIGCRSSESWITCWLFSLGRWARYATILQTRTWTPGTRESDGTKSHEKHGKKNSKQLFPISCNKRTMKYSLNVQTRGFKPRDWLPFGTVHKCILNTIEA